MDPVTLIEESWNVGGHALASVPGNGGMWSAEPRRLERGMRLMGFQFGMHGQVG